MVVPPGLTPGQGDTVMCSSRGSVPNAPSKRVAVSPQHLRLRRCSLDIPPRTPSRAVLMPGRDNTPTYPASSGKFAASSALRPTRRSPAVAGLGAKVRLEAAATRLLDPSFPVSLPSWGLIAAQGGAGSLQLQPGTRRSRASRSTWQEVLGAATVSPITSDPEARAAFIGCF